MYQNGEGSYACWHEIIATMTKVSYKGSSRIVDIIKSVHRVLLFCDPLPPYEEYFENVDVEAPSSNCNAPFKQHFLKSVRRPSQCTLVKIMAILDDP